MNLCSKNHAEIVYEEKYCPLCQEINEKEQLQSDYNDLNNNYNDLYKSTHMIEKK